MKRRGKADQYIRNVDKALSALSKRCDLDDTEFVKNTIAKIESVGYKRNLTYAYDLYVQFHGLKWIRPHYWVPQKVPKIPLNKHIEAIIGCASQKTATAMAISKDTGVWPIELCNLTPEHIDLERGIIYPESAKHGTARALKLTRRTLSMLINWISKNNIGRKQKIFGNWDSDNYGKSFRYYRNKVAKKLNEPAIRDIKLYNLRHFFATMLLRKCNNIVIVKEKLGHNNIKNTMIYAQVVDLLDENNFACEIAINVEQAKRLIENGYEYVTGEYDDGGKLFRKRK
jgi:integrase